MSCVNEMRIIGNLGAKPEIHAFHGGGEIASFSVATTEKWTDRSTGEIRSSTQWHRIVSRISLDYIKNHLEKGSRIYVEGQMRYRTVRNQKEFEYQVAEVHVAKILLLSSSRPRNESVTKSERNSAPVNQARNTHQSNDESLDVNSVDERFFGEGGADALYFPDGSQNRDASHISDPALNRRF